MHWLMQEPELEDDSLTLDPSLRGLEIERSTLGNAPGAVEIISPSGQRSEAGLDETAPGLYRGEAPATEQGLYEARSGNLRAFAAVGPLNPREAGALAANPEILRPFANAQSSWKRHLATHAHQRMSAKTCATPTTVIKCGFSNKRLLTTLQKSLHLNMKPLSPHRFNPSFTAGKNSLACIPTPQARLWPYQKVTTDSFGLWRRSCILIKSKHVTSWRNLPTASTGYKSRRKVLHKLHASVR